MIGIAVCIIIFAIYVLAVIANGIRRKDESAWVNTDAHLTGRKNTYKASAHSSGYFHVPTEHTEYEIEYWVNGQKYVKWIESAPSEKAGTRIPIQYYKERPSSFRER